MSVDGSRSAAHGSAREGAGGASGSGVDGPDEGGAGASAGFGLDGGKEGGAGAAIRPWLLAAAACVAASGVFWWGGMGDAAFVAAVFGVVAWFLNQRAHYKKIRDENEYVEDDAEDENRDAAGRG